MRKMPAWSVTSLSLFATLVIASDGRADHEALLQASRAATKVFGATLKEQLTTAIAAGGPVLAIDVCKTVAGEIAAEVSAKHGLAIRRTALRVRNEKNAPDAFEREGLERFVAAIADGKDSATLDYAEVIESEGGVRTFRYLKAIPTAAEPCLACHGSDIAKDVQLRLREAYPNDQATGFQAGELRGAFSVSIDMR